MTTLLDTSDDGRLSARYLSDRSGVLMRAEFGMTLSASVSICDVLQPYHRPPLSVNVQ